MRSTLVLLSCLACCVTLAGCFDEAETEASSEAEAKAKANKTQPEAGPESEPEPGSPTSDGGPTPGDAQGAQSGCSGAEADPAAATEISRFMDTLPYGSPKEPLRGRVIDAIIRTCHSFAPSSSAPGWATKYCHAHLVAAINKESTHNPNVVVTDGYATRKVNGTTANDPTVGLLQIRFSATVNDYVSHAPLDSLTCIGCAVPAEVTAHAGEPGDSHYWAVSGPTANMSLLQDVACNVAFGAYYYYMNATGNGSSAKPTYAAAYCAGHGVEANLVTGLLSHLTGPSGGKGVITGMAGVDALEGSDPNAHEYVTRIKSWFDVMLPTAGGTHPFFLLHAPARERFCR